MKAQSFAIDLMLGMFLITITIVSVILFLPRNEAAFNQDQERIAILMTEGIPSGWNNTTVIMPGFLSNHHFNKTKIDAFAAFSINDQRSLLGITSDFTITFFDNGTLLPLCSTCGAVPAQYKQTLVITRYGIYAKNITMMEVQLYQ